MSTIKRIIGAALLLVSMLAWAGEPINLNSADAETLAAHITGIGPAKAAAIVASREKNGPFKTVDDLLVIQGSVPLRSRTTASASLLPPPEYTRIPSSG